MELDSKEYRLLKKFYKTDGYLTITQQSRELKSLLNERLIEREILSEDAWGHRVCSDQYRIKDEGEKQFLLKRTSNLRWRIPTALSIMAIIIAIFALLKP